MDPHSAVAELISGLDCQGLRRNMEGMEKTMVEIVGLKRKRFHFEIGSGSVDLDDEAIVAPKLARSLVEERSLPTAAAACKIDLTLDSDSDDDDDCVVTGFVMPQVTLPRALADCNNPDNEDECVTVDSVVPEISTLVGARAGCNVVQVTHDSAAVEDDDDCVITGWSTRCAVLIRDVGFFDELRSAVEADVDEFSSDSGYSIGSIPASVSAGESDDGFNTLESDDGSGASESDGESSVPEWDHAHYQNCWGWYD